MKIKKTLVDRKVKDLGLKKNYLIRKTNVSRATFYKYIAGEYDIPESKYTFIASLAYELKVPLLELVGKKPSTPEQREKNYEKFQKEAADHLAQGKDIKHLFRKHNVQPLYLPIEDKEILDDLDKNGISKQVV